MIKENPAMNPDYTFQGVANDHLYQATYSHPPLATSCDSCDSSQEVVRDRRGSTDPRIYYGSIASGDQVIKDGATRERLRKELGALCSEIEAAGLVLDFPCLVIRGICGYSDSHKNKIWQDYAAATAAAFAKEFLHFTSAPQVRQEKTIMQVSDPVLQETASRISLGIIQHTQKQQSRHKNDKQRECHQAFKTSTYEDFKNINPDRIPGTCMWILDHRQYLKWRGSHKDDLLRISADPGGGKSALSKSLIDNELQASETHAICYFFKDNEDQNSISTALCALLHQLFGKMPSLLQHAMTSWENSGSSLRQEADELWRVLINAATDPAACNITCVFDALDECRQNDRTKLIRFLNAFYTVSFRSKQRNSQLKFLVTSRPYDHIEREFHGVSADLPTIRLLDEEENDRISAEIDMVIKASVSDVSKELRVGKDVQSALEEKLLSMSHRTYLWLHLVMEEVRSSLRRTLKGISDIVDSIPESVEDAYEMLLTKHSNKPCERLRTQTLLHLIVAARRPLLLKELDVAFQIATEDAVTSYYDLGLDREHFAIRIRNLCGLFVFVKDMRFCLIRHTAKEFLVAKGPIAAAEHRWKHSLEEHASEMVMAKACTSYLLFADFREPCIGEENGLHANEKIQSLESSGRDSSRDEDTQSPGDSEHDSSEDEDSQPSENPEYDFMDYSALNWASHLSNADTDGHHPLLQTGLMLCKPGSKCFRIWFSRYWVVVRDYRRRLPPQGLNSFHVAALLGQEALTKLLLETDTAELDLKDEGNRTPRRRCCGRPIVDMKLW